MTPTSTLREEIETLLLSRIDNGQITNTAALAEEIMNAHHYRRLRKLQDPVLKTEDREFYETCAWNHVKVIIRSVVHDYKVVHSETPEQLVLPGFAYVQKAYAIEQEGEARVVPVSLMSKAELIAKSQELRQMATGCLAHADELDRYRVDKFGR